MRLALVGLLLMGAVVTGSCGPALKSAAPVFTSSGVRFELVRQDATSVALAGSLNQWSTTSHPLARDGRGVWTLVVPLPAGEHRFMFIVDGQWESPPVAEDYSDDGFGQKNGIVWVK